MTTLPTLRAHCRECDGERVCDVHGATKTSWEWESADKQHSMEGGADHTLLQCRGCEAVFYQKSAWDSEDVDQWYEPDGSVGCALSRTITSYPKPESKTKPAWVSNISRTDNQLGDILDETYVAYDNRSFILTSVGLRTALDRATEVLKIDASKTFAEKLTELEGSGWIGKTEKDILEVVIDAGNAAAHRGWSPGASEVAQLLSAMEVFLQKAFIVEKKALGLKSSIPAKPKRAKAPPPTLPSPPTTP